MSHRKTENAQLLKVMVNGKEIPTNDFVTTIFTNVLSAMISSLHIDEKEIHSIHIEIEKKGAL